MRVYPELTTPRHSIDISAPSFFLDAFSLCHICSTCKSIGLLRGMHSSPHHSIAVLKTSITFKAFGVSTAIEAFPKWKFSGWIHAVLDDFQIDLLTDYSSTQQL